MQELEGENGVDVIFSEKDVTSVLGLKWIPSTDEFTYVVNFQELTTLTKRTIMSKIGQLFDPTGFLSPVRTHFKVLVQLYYGN